MDLTTITAWLSANAENPLLWAAVCLAVYGVLPHVVALTPSLADDKALGVATRVLNLLVGNYGAARNGAALAGRIIGDPPRRSDAGRTLGSYALVLVLAGSFLVLPGCTGTAPTSGSAASSIATAQRWLPLIETAADAYCASPGAKPAVVDSVKAAKATLHASLIAAERAVRDGEDPADAALMAGVDVALGEALAILLRQGIKVEEPR